MLQKICLIYVALTVLVFTAVHSDPIVNNKSSRVYQQICTKPNTEFKQICKQQPSCNQVGSFPEGSMNCLEGCFCIKGYVLNSVGDCILPETCPGVDCPTNMTFGNCADGCRKNCKTQYLTSLDTCRCKPGCHCNEGYVYDATGKCIKSADCDPQVILCPSNMAYNKCQSNVETCNGPILYKKCPSGCFCKEGMVLENENNCVLKEKCSKNKTQLGTNVEQEIEENEEQNSCPKNQIFKNCSLCGRSCENQYIDIMFKCLCKPGCACDTGFIWKDNTQTQCIKPEECTQENTRCQKTQHFGINEIRKTCIRPSGNGQPTSGCFCNNDLVFNEDTRTCIKAEDCPNAQCGPRMSYHECFEFEIRTCKTKKIAKVQEVESVECKSGCFCNGPFVLDEGTGKCMHPQECPNSKENQMCIKDDPNTEFRMCQSSTKPTCTNPKPTIFTQDCRNECRCKEGFVFNSIVERCMTLEECYSDKYSKNTSCDTNSTYSTCATACPQTCSDVYLNTNAITKCLACYEGCECKAGYLQTNSKRCMLIKDCPIEEIVCPQDRKYHSCKHVIKSCTGNISRNDTCLHGCFCSNNMVQDQTGRCILPGKCPNSEENQACRKEDMNSHFEHCQFIKCTCSDPTGTNRKQKCMHGCFCDDGFVYYKKVKRCVRLDQCH